MREIFTDPDYTKVGYYQSILEAEGIATFIRNQHSHHNLAEMPIGVLHPSLCVVADGDYDRAMQLLRPIYQPQEPIHKEWICPSCSEFNPGSFELCWNCQAAHPQPPSPR